jgi:hypothetical protein
MNSSLGEQSRRSFGPNPANGRNKTALSCLLGVALCALLICLALLVLPGHAHAQSTSACDASTPLIAGGTNAIFGEPVVNVDGTRVVYVSTYDPFAGVNFDGSIELFVANSQSVSLTAITVDQQVTESRGNILGGFNIMPDMISYFDQADMRHTLIVFASDRDLTGANPDGGFEIFLAQTEPENWLVQLTDTRRSASILPSISQLQADGTLRVLFLSDADDREALPNAINSDRNQELFLATVTLNGAKSSIASVTQVTQTDVDVLNDQPTINGAGDHIAFVSTARSSVRPGNPVNNSDGNRELILGMFRVPQ